jgi:hypothetical protein
MTRWRERAPLGRSQTGDDALTPSRYQVLAEDLQQTPVAEVRGKPTGPFPPPQPTVLTARAAQTTRVPTVSARSFAR